MTTSAPSLWCNDTTLKFIGLYEAESVIWNPNHAQHKDKIAINDAWNRIAIIMGAQVPDLKRKKESLMTRYRALKKRQRKGEEKECVTSWYAFRSLDSFLDHLYENDKDNENNLNYSMTTMKNEDTEDEDKLGLDVWHDESSFPILELASSASVKSIDDSCSTNNIHVWSNDTTLKFLKHYKDESVIWDTNNRNYKSKAHSKEAWKRIAYHMNGDVTDLKRKKESLMARYRALKKIKESAGDTYAVTWFAFDYMDSFLGFLYPVGKLCPSRKSQDNIQNSRQTVYIEEHLEMSSPEPSSPQSEYSHLNLTSNGDQVLKRSSTNIVDEDECDLFGRLLAKKLRRYSLTEQLELMHKIDALLLPNRDMLS